MDQMQIQPAELRGTAEQFDLAKKDLAAILERLDTATGSLESKWSGASQQTFYKQYAELRQYMGGFSLLLGQISLELNAMVDHFEELDSKP